jgi:hypothetical protein
MSPEKENTMTTGEKLYSESGQQKSWCALSGPERLEWIERGLAEGGEAGGGGAGCTLASRHSFGIGRRKR